MENQGLRGRLSRHASRLATSIPVVLWIIAGALPVTANEPDIPSTGRSLFDIVVTEIPPEGGDARARLSVPFPFQRLRALIKQAGGLSDRDIAETLIPLGRSLQRQAAAPDYFASPRRVFGVIAAPRHADPSTTLVLKDRLFIGYQPRTNSLEVISFNEAAGRFEFQIVEDYAPGKTPRVLQARRALCLGCHGNGGPIFAESPWSETPANPAIAARLTGAFGAGQPDAEAPSARVLQQNRRAAAALHHATSAANRLIHAARYWRATCADPASRDRCQTKLLAGVLAVRGGQTNANDHSRQELETIFSTTQARAWPDGFAFASPFVGDIDPLAPHDAKARDLADPLNERPPAAVLDVAQDKGVDRILDLLGEAFTERRIAWLKDTIRDPGRQEATLSRSLGHPPPGWCCGAHDELPPPVAASPPPPLRVPGLSEDPGPAHPSLQAFHRACGACHSGSGTAPPNFLFGPSARQIQAITDCAPRILKRLNQWEARGGALPTTMPPMPPPQHLAGIGQSPDDWLASADYRRIARLAAALGEGSDTRAKGSKMKIPVCAPTAE